MRRFFCSRLGSVLLVTVLALTVGACGTTKISDIRDFDTQFLAGDYRDSATFANQMVTEAAAKKADKGDQKRGLLWALEGGAAYRMGAQFDASTAIFNKAEDLIKAQDMRLAAGKAAGQAGAVLLNDRARAYEGEEYDGIMVNTYQALNAMAMQRWDEARVQLNRAYIRQQRAVERFQKQIQKQEEALKEDKKKAGSAAKGASGSEADKTINKYFPEMNQWQAYPDFVNPFTSYLYGLYFFAAGEGASDLEKATTSLKRVIGMMPDVDVLEADAQLFEDVAAGRVSKAAMAPQVWVIFENGLGPIKEEKRFDAPTLSSNVAFVSLALPKLKFRPQAHTHLVVHSDGAELGRTQMVASMDRVVQTEFKKDLPGIYTRAFVSMAAKAVIQKQAGDRLGILGTIAGAIFQGVSTRADLRIWTILPKDFQAVRVERPANGHLLITAPSGGSVADVMVPDTQFSMVYVKKLNQSLAPMVSIVPFPS